MGEQTQGILRQGLRLVRHRQRVLWWVYAVNFALALLGTLPASSEFGAILNRSLAADRLSRGFDLPVYEELAAHPEVSLRGAAVGSVFSALLFFLFMLFVTGGILEVYRSDRTLAASEFFQACGSYFWRFVRLVLFLLIALVPIGIAFGRVYSWSNRLASDAPGEMLGFWVQVVGWAVVLLLFLAVRLWFDLAQVRTVAENERKVRRSLVAALKLGFGNFWQLFWIFLRIRLLGWAGLLAAVWVWVTVVPPHRPAISFLLGQAVLLWLLTTRLWQRAAETLWYQTRQPAPAAETAGPAPSDLPQS